MRILFVTSNRIGDCVLSTGLLAHLLEQAPNARVTVACGPAPAPLFRAVPGLERIIVMAKGKMAAHWRHLWRETALTWWDLVVDLRASAFAWTVPAARRIVYRPTHNPIHRARQLGALVGRFDDPPTPRVWLDDRARAEADRLIPAGGPVLAVGPAANWAGKQWPADRFVAAVERLTAAGGILPGARVAVFAAANERPAAQPVLDALAADRRIDLVGATDLPAGAACLERCAFYLGNDSGLMHMAAATGIPTLGVFGPSNDALYAPWGRKAAFVRADKSFRDYIEAADYDYATTVSLMTDLDVDRVVDAATALWGRVVG
ncbi:MAG: glycosyltransferase family 9 protein [Solirubrobacterales bacterium]